MFYLLFQGEVLVKISDCCSKCEKAQGKISIKNVCIFFHLLAHLAKGNVSFCHHLASVVRLLFTF